MSAPLRFLVVAMVGWTAFRAATLGILPGADGWAARAETAAPPPVAETYLQPPAPPMAGPAFPNAYWTYDPYAPYGPPPQQQPAVIRLAMPASAYAAHAVPLAQSFAAAPAFSAVDADPQFYAPIATLDDWDLAQIARPDRRGGASSPMPTPGGPPVQPARLDRLQLSSWALLRGPSGQGALASGGTLGGSQAGARLTYAIDRRLAVSLRSYAPIGGTAQGGEVAAGIRLTPLPSMPLSITAERRQAVGRGGGRSDFALFAEGGVYQKPLPWRFSLDAYAQAGIVGIAGRDLFLDGGMTATRPVYGPVSAGLGLWGGSQPGLTRIDAGPRLSMRVRRNMRVALDWRQKLHGNAEPGSGPALTLAADW